MEQDHHRAELVWTPLDELEEKPHLRQRGKGTYRDKVDQHRLLDWRRGVNLWQVDDGPRILVLSAFDVKTQYSVL